MMKTGLRVATALSTVLILGISAPAFGQDSSEPKAGAGEDSGDIIVTARRTEERLQDVPISITVMNQEAISKRNIVSTADLGAYVPSLSVNQQFGPEKASFVIRGFTQSYHTAPTVGVYFADVIAPRALGPTTSGNGAGVGSLFDLQSLQVLKGPQGTLFGRNTTGGAILLVPQKPTDKLEGYVEGSVGNYDMHRIQAVLNVPLSDSIRIRGGVDWNQRDGYVINHSGIGPKDFDNMNYVAARLSVVADVTPNLENYTIFSYSHSRTNGDVPKVSVCDQTAANAFLQEAAAFNFSHLLNWVGCGQVARQNARGDGLWDVESNNAHPLELIKQWQIINTTTWKASDALTVKNIMSYSQYHESGNFNLWGDNFLIPPGTPFAGVFLPPVGSLLTKAINLEQGFYPWTTAQSSFTEEFQLHGRAFGGRLDWQAGAYFEISRPLDWNSQLVDIFINCSNVQQLACTPTSSGSISDSNTKDWFNNYGLYAQATYKITDHLNVSGGFRYTMDRQKDLAENLNILIPTTSGQGVFICQNPIMFHGPGGFRDPLVVTDPSKCDVTTKIKSNRPTWMIDLEYKPSSDVMIYAKYSRGYRQGSITSNSIGFETVGPEKVDSYEVGAKTSFRGAVPGYFNIAWFYNDFRDQQLTVNSVIKQEWLGIIPPAAPNVNAGKSRMWGIEADASLNLFRGFKLDAAYTYLNTKLIAFTPPPLPIYYSALFPATDVGQPLALSPKNRVTISGTYTLPLDEKVGRISFGVTFVHTDANRASTPDATPVYLVNASNLVNLNANWNSMFGMPVDLSFFMTNATNEGMIVYPSQAYHQIGIDGGHVNQPRMWGFSLKYHFGD